jgi:hypothetical protein
MKTLIAQVAAVLALALSLPAAAADCVYPRAPATMPDGATATLEEMKASKKEYDQYNSDMTVYLDCVRTEHEASVPKIEDGMSEKKKQEVQKQIKESEERYIAKNDSAVDELKGIMDRFNEQIRAFNAKRKAEKEKSGG